MSTLRTRCALSVAGALVAAVAVSPAGLAAKRRCPHLRERAGCVLKSAAYAGNTQFGSAPTYALLLTIGGSGGSSMSGALTQATCTGGDPSSQGRNQAALIARPRLPKRLTIGKTYKKSAHIDRVENTGQTRVRLISSETVKVKLVSAKRAKVTITIDQSTQNVEPPDDDPPYHCTGSGSERLKRRY